MSRNAEGTRPARPKRDVEIGVFLVGLVCLMVELLHTRMLAFFLGSISNFLAIPVALFGLATGSLLVHRGRKAEETDARLIASLQALVLPVLTVAFVGFFAVANTFFPVIHVSLENPYVDAARMLAYSGIFLPSYALFGALLALYFHASTEPGLASQYRRRAQGPDPSVMKRGSPSPASLALGDLSPLRSAARGEVVSGQGSRLSIGRLYFFDLAGAASGCLLAPLVLTWAGLPSAILTALLGALALLAATPPVWKRAHRRLAIGAGAVGYCVVALLAYHGTVLQEHPDAVRLSRYVLGGYARADAEVEEMRVRWNDLARTSLVRADPRNPKADGEDWGIVQDDGISNVKVLRWDPAAKPSDLLPYSLHHALPFVMGHEPKHMLVLFAGVGRDMIELDCMAQGRADITGVELNPAVVDLVRDPLLAGMNLRPFFARPNMHLVVREGRDFLNNDRGRYDLLFVATNGSVNAERTGHTRKYLDTFEAMASYLDHLAPDPGSMMVFVNQPVLHKAESLRLLFAERGLGDFGKAVFAFGAPETRGQDSMVVKPGGLTGDELAAIERKVASWPYPRRVLYSPSGTGEPRFVDAVLGRTRGPLVTDDRPFVHEVSWRDFELFPAQARFGDQLYAASWIKVFTVLLFGVVSVVVMVFVGLGPGRGRERRVPWPWVLYFFVAGVSYMCVEIGLIAKSELLLGSPLYAVAVILALFLAASGLGAYLQDRLRMFRGPATLVLPAILAIVWGILATHLCNVHLLSLPLPLKILCVALCVVPAGTFLGMFYPFGVEGVVAAGHHAAVPATYAMATLSSVWGAAWAMTAITNLGFSAVILMGAAGYALTGALVLVARWPRP
jgi:hypothetical protein